MKNIIALVVIGALLLSASMFTNYVVRARAEGDDSELSKKMDDIIKSQKDILQGITELKEELRIVKIRVTQAQ